MGFDWQFFQLVVRTKSSRYQKLKGVIFIDSSRYWKSYFFVATGLIFSIKVSIERVILVEENSIEKSYDVFLWSNFW